MLFSVWALASSAGTGTGKRAKQYNQRKLARAQKGIQIIMGHIARQREQHIILDICKLTRHLGGKGGHVPWISYFNFFTNFFS